MEIPQKLAESLIWLGIDVEEEVRKEEGRHECRESKTCCCSIIALEPDEDCPIHGYPWPPRCEICGQFMKWKEKNG